MSKHILLTGYYGYKNFGDDLFGLAALDGIKKINSDYKVIILSPPVNGINGRYLVPKQLDALYNKVGYIGMTIRVLFMIYGCLRYKNLVLGGGSVVSSGSSSLIRYIQIPLAKLKLCRISAIGISVGPFITEKDKFKAKKFLNQLSYLTVRDKSSFDECIDMGLNVPVHLFNDLAGCSNYNTVQKNSIKSNTLGVCLCNYESYIGGDTDVEKLRNIAIFEGIINFAIKHNVIVKIIVLNSNSDVGDSGISNDLFMKLKEHNINSMLVKYNGPHDAIKNIASCDMFFSVRLHGGIVAYLLDIPFVLVEYHKKCEQFLNYIGYANNRVLGNISSGVEVLLRLENSFLKYKYPKLTSNEYKLISSKIFSKSPWLNN